MKNKKVLTRLLMLTILVLGAISLVTACNKTPPKQTSSSYAVDIGVESLTLYCYEDVTFNAYATLDSVPTTSQITYTSSNTQVATIDANGKLSALSTGTTTVTASANGVSASCVVTVIQPRVQPTLVISAVDSVSVKVLESFQLSPYIVYNDNVYTDATFSYSTSHTNLFDVSQNGLIEAKEVGDGAITVTASWRGFSGSSLTSELSVTVLENVQVAILSNGNETLHTTNKDLGDGKEYTNSATYTASVTYNGTVLDEVDEYKWISSVTTVAEINELSGEITALNPGETEIYYEFTSTDSNIKYYSNRIILQVQRPTITSDVQLTIDASVQNIALSADQFFQDADQIIEVHDVTTQEPIEFLYSDGNVSGDLKAGNRIWKIANSEYAVTAQILVVSKIITTASDLEIFDFTATDKVNDGYYILGGNIDATSFVSKTQAWGTSASLKGLTGTFDGCGYTISNIALGQGGLFGNIGSGGVVRNVAFTNVTLKTGANCTVLANLVHGSAQISNVFVEVTNWNANHNTSPLILGTKGHNSAFPVFKNVMIIAHGTPPTNPGNYGAGSMFLDSGNMNGATCSNVFVVSTVPILSDRDEMNGVLRFDSIDLFKQNVTTSTLTGFDDCWDLTGDYPVFKTA